MLAALVSQVTFADLTLGAVALAFIAGAIVGRISK